MGTTIMVHGTHAKDDPERATMPFVVGNVAVNADQPAVVLLTVDGVWLATHSYSDTIHKDGLPPLNEVIESFVAGGGQIWACGACTKPRGITEADLIAGARIVTAASVVECLATGTATLNF